MRTRLIRGIFRHWHWTRTPTIYIGSALSFGCSQYPSMKITEVVYDVINVFLSHFTLFPMRQCFHSVAESVGSSSDDTLTRFKESSRESASLLTAQLSSSSKSGKSAARSMQLMRTSVNVFNILDATMMKIGVVSSRDVTDENHARLRCAVYDCNAESIRSLHGSLPLWFKSLPSVVILYFRCAVKVAQKKYVMGTSNVIGTDVVDVFTEYTKGEAALELENLCGKLQKYLTGLKDFVEMNCCIPEMDPSIHEKETRESFKETLRKCKSLLLRCNECVPIFNVLNNTLRKRLEEAWEFEGEGMDIPMNDVSQQSDKGMLFCVNDKNSVDMFEDIRYLREVATGMSESFARVAAAQLSVIEASHHLCSKIAKAGLEVEKFKLRNVGHIEDRPGPPSKKRKVGSSIAGEELVQNRVEVIRNNHLQVDLVCLWESMLTSDKYLEKELVRDLSSTYLQMHLSDQWYEQLFASMLVPSIVQGVVWAPNSKLLVEASALILKRFRCRS